MRECSPFLPCPSRADALTAMRNDVPFGISSFARRHDRFEQSWMDDPNSYRNEAKNVSKSGCDYDRGNRCLGWRE